MTATWFDGHLILALFVAPAFSIWFVGIVNNRLAAKARKRARVTHVGQWDRWQ
jgi:hypothetical protein